MIKIRKGKYINRSKVWMIRLIFRNYDSYKTLVCQGRIFTYIVQ